MKKVMIVFEETEAADLVKDGRPGFKVYMDGDIQRIGKTDVNSLTAAEFWGLRCFQIVADTMKKAGSIKTATMKAAATPPPAPESTH